MGSKAKTEASVTFTEAQSNLLSIVVWLVFGLLVFGDHILGVRDPAVILYAILSLTVVRMTPVAIALLGSGFDPVSVAFIGWFGPRALASVIFVILGREALENAGVPSDPLGPVVSWTVVLSVVAHGFSARPFAAFYGRYAEGLAQGNPERLGDEEPRRATWPFHQHDRAEHESDQAPD
jgi:NhaP-type Na+/H+ and K+/H+ antiporter